MFCGLRPEELAGEIANASRFTDWTVAQPEMTFHSFPDGTLVDDLQVRRLAAQSRPVVDNLERNLTPGKIYECHVTPLRFWFRCESFLIPHHS